jgi:hypothetical protein
MQINLSSDGRSAEIEDALVKGVPLEDYIVDVFVSANLVYRDTVAQGEIDSVDYKLIRDAETGEEILWEEFGHIGLLKMSKILDNYAADKSELMFGDEMHMHGEGNIIMSSRTVGSLDDFLSAIEAYVYSSGFRSNWEEYLKYSHKYLKTQAQGKAEFWAESNEVPLGSPEFLSKLNEIYKEILDDKLEELVDDALDEMKWIDYDSEGVYLYRCVTVPDAAEFVERLRAGTYSTDRTGLGVYWAYKEEKAECHYGNLDEDLVFLEAKAPWSSIDVEGTVEALTVPTTGMEESEIRLIKGAPIHLLKVEEDHGAVNEKVNLKMVAKRADMKSDYEKLLECADDRYEGGRIIREHHGASHVALINYILESGIISKKASDYTKDFTQIDRPTPQDLRDYQFRSPREERAARESAQKKLMPFNNVFRVPPIIPIKHALRSSGFDTTVLDQYSSSKQGEIKGQVGPNTFIMFSWYKSDTNGRYDTMVYLAPHRF